jgi:hypothetical protein
MNLSLALSQYTCPHTLNITDELFKCCLALVGGDSGVHGNVLHDTEVIPHLIGQPREVAEFWDQTDQVLHILQPKAASSQRTTQVKLLKQL